MSPHDDTDDDHRLGHSAGQQAGDERRPPRWPWQPAGSAVAVRGAGCGTWRSHSYRRSDEAVWIHVSASCFEIQQIVIQPDTDSRAKSSVSQAGDGPPMAGRLRAGRPLSVARPHDRRRRRAARRSAARRSFQCSGRLIAGCPLELNGGVNGTNAAGPDHRGHRRCGIVGERSDRGRRLGERRGQQQVPSVGPPLLHRPAELDVGGERQGVVDGADALGELDLCAVDGLDVVVAQGPAELRPRCVAPRRPCWCSTAPRTGDRSRGWPSAAGKPCSTWWPSDSSSAAADANGVAAVVVHWRRRAGGGRGGRCAADPDRRRARRRTAAAAAAR